MGGCAVISGNTVTLDTVETGGAITRRGTKVGPFMVHRGFLDPSIWVVTAPCGWKVGHFATKADAVKAANAIEPIPMDWTNPDPIKVVKKKHKPAVRKALEGLRLY